MLFFKHRLFFRFLLIVFLLPVVGYSDVGDTSSEIYARIGQGKKVAIFIIDMQQRFFKSFHSNDEYLSVLDQQSRLMAEFASNESVFFIDVNYVHEKLSMGPTVTSLLEHARRGQHYKLWSKTKDGAFEDFGYHASIHITNQAEPEEDYLVINTDLEAYLHTEGITDIVPTGCFSDACILRTAEGALDRGFSVVADRDLMIVQDARDLTSSITPADLEDISRGNWEYYNNVYENLKVIESHTHRQLPCSL